MGALQAARTMMKKVGDVADPLHESRDIQKILEKNGYNRTGGCAYFLPGSTSPGVSGIFMTSFPTIVPVCRCDVYRKDGDVVIIGDYKTMLSDFPYGKDARLAELCGDKPCPNNKRMMSLGEAHMPLKIADTGEALKYLQHKFSSQ